MVSILPGVSQSGSPVVTFHFSSVSHSISRGVVNLTLLGAIPALLRLLKKIQDRFRPSKDPRPR